MCIHITFICPGCKHASGITETKHCVHYKDDEYPGIAELERLNEQKHFFGWHCATRFCGYSRQTTSINALEILDIKKAEGQGRVQYMRRDSVSSNDSMNSNDVREILEASPDEDDPRNYAEPVSPKKRTRDDSEDHESAEEDEHAIKRRKLKDARRKNLTEGFVDIWSDALPEKPRNALHWLRAQVDRQGGQRKGTAFWNKDEDNLLLICNKLGLPIAQTSPFLPCHRNFECKSRLEHLLQQSKASKNIAKSSASSFKGKRKAVAGSSSSRRA
ncbi:hypothetical protein B0H66DRAFT_644332 [Apodospora peruviana]|uniref:Uncharacterized protein n=1 Tax=Apodospora peruviana TaxID=516989 RepID=A0AAE0HUQ9_9PEZI|nr:hypothetical protein B0H66DRAFT_644332 [Apodospora peruviana]